MSIKALLLRLLATRCEPYEYGRFKVWSTEDEETFYLVDTLEYGGAGRCDCPDFRTRIYPVREGTKILSEDERANFVGCCKHIVRAKIAMGDTLALAMIKQERTIKHQTS